MVRAHLDQCAECRALADELREVSAGLGEWAVEPAPDTLVAPAIAIGPLGYRANGLLKMMAPRWVLATAAAIGVVAIAVSWLALRVRPAVDVNGTVDGRSSVASTLEPKRPQGRGAGGARAS